MSDIEDRLADLAAIRKGLVIGAVSYDGDDWFAADAGYGYDEAQADLNRAFAALDKMDAALAAAPQPLDWPTLANIIREVDGNHDLGAGELAQRIIEHPRFAAPEAES